MRARPLRPESQLFSTRSVRIALVLAALALSSAVGHGRSLLNPPAGAFGVVGLQASRGYFTDLPIGTVDMVNATATVAIPGVSLPGNNGMDVRVTAWVGQQSFGLGATDIAFAVLPGTETPTLMMHDGAQKKLFANVVPNVLVTTDFWRYDPTQKKLHLPDGRIATYQEYPSGNPLILPYVRLSKIEDAFGNEIRFAWTGTNALYPLYVEQDVAGTNGTQTRRIDFWTSPDAQTRTVTYDGKTWTYTNASFQPPIGPAWQFSRVGFDDINDVSGTLSITLPTGGTVAFTYEQIGEDDFKRTRLQSVTTGGRAVLGGTWTFTFDGLGSQTSQVTTPSGRTITYVHDHYDGPNGTDWMLKSKTLSLSGQSSTVQWTYGDAQFLSNPAKSVKIPLTQSITQDGQTYTTQYEYHDTPANFRDYRRPWKIIQSASFNPQTRVVERTFDYAFNRYLVNRIKEEKVTIGGQSFTYSVEFDDNTGALTQSTSLGLTATFGHDSSGNPNLTTDPLNHQATVQYQWGVASAASGGGPAVSRAINPDGSVASETVGGVTTSFGYDALGRVTSVTPPEGASTATSYASDLSWVTVSTTGSAATTTVDGFGRPILVENSEGVKMATTYDAEGRKTFESHPWTGGGGGTGTSYEYDYQGRILRITHADGSYRWFYRVNQNVVEIDELGRQITQFFESFGTPGNGRLSTLHDGSRYWNYSYNALGSLTKVETAGAPDRVWTYDSNNRLIAETHPESGTATFTYNGDGLLASKTTGLGTVTYGYDADHQLVTIDYPGTADDTTFTYDARGNRTAAVLGNGNETRFTYDALNQLRSREERVNGQVFTSLFDYDVRGNLKFVTYPSGRVVKYDYDGADRITKVYTDSQVYAQNISYHPSGSISSLSYGNGQTQTLTLDARNRPKDWTSGPLQVTYGYDVTGNVTSIADARGTYTTFGYDFRDRLTHINGQVAYTYDDFGNRLTKSSPAVSYYYDSNNRLSFASASTGAPEEGAFQYDSVGNMTSFGHVASGVAETYTYSPRGTMTSATINGATTNYAYDADGLRVMKSSGTGNRYLLYGLGSQLLAEYASLFTKTAPTSGSSGSSTSVTLTWSESAGAEAYAYCVHTVNNSCNGVPWTWNGGATTRTLTNLAPGTYYWQAFVLKNGQWQAADSGTWWSFTVGAGGFGKQGPASGQGGLGSSVTVQWDSVPDSGYWICWDQTNNSSCDTMWWPNGGNTTKPLEDLSPGTYYWQVLADTPNGQIPADGGTWWSFTVTGGSGTFTKVAPAHGLAGQPTTVVASWTAVPNEGYWICWDQVDNNQCDTMWWPNGGATSKWLENLSPGTYYWQVKTADNPIEANNGTWWSFTVGAPITSFGKLTPGAGGIATTNVVNFTWQAAPGAQFYEFCADTINNNICDTMWFPATATSRLHGALTDGTYYWQVRATTASGSALANDGAWFTLTVDAPDPIREYIYLGGTLLASLAFPTPTPVLTYYHTDMLGSVRAITDVAGGLVLRHDFGAFGEGGSMQGDPRQFTGQERDSETALDYFKARYLRPVWGRFTSPDDPVFMNPYDPQSLNPYAYVRNNPLRWIDPSGHDIEDPQNPRFTDQVTVRGCGGCWDPDEVKYWIEYDHWQRFIRWTNRTIVEPAKAMVAEEVAAHRTAATNFANGTPTFSDVMVAASITPPGRVIRWVGLAGRVVSRSTLVIGRTRDLQRIAAGERTLLPRLTPNLGNPRANWYRNAGELRAEMQRGLPIRDASPGDRGGQFLNAERALLAERGWTFNAQTGYWLPPIR